MSTCYAPGGGQVVVKANITPAPVAAAGASRCGAHTRHATCSLRPCSCMTWSSLSASSEDSPVLLLQLSGSCSRQASLAAAGRADSASAHGAVTEGAA
eukprot:366357-Chlamydomonas_euryale.AAC.8